jgi:ribonuclease HI
MQCGKHVKEISGYDVDTTNNRMELQAVIEGLQALNKVSSVVIFTDSTYVYKGMTEWIEGWRMRGWQKKHNEAVKNADLWQNLYTLSQKHNIIWQWVRGHDSCHGNNLADKLAVDARKVAEKLRAGC